MAEQSKIQYGTMEGVALQMVFGQASFEPYKSIYKKMTNVKDYSEGLNRAKDGDYAFIAEKSWFYAIAANDDKIVMINELFYPNSYAFAMQKNSPLVQIFSNRINKFREIGLLARWTDKWVPKGASLIKKKHTAGKKATLDDIQGSIYVLFIGIGLAVVALIIEVSGKMLSPKLKRYA